MNQILKLKMMARKAKIRIQARNQSYKILPGLYIGSWKVAVRRGSLKKLGITHIIHLIEDKDPLYPEVSYIHKGLTHLGLCLSQPDPKEIYSIPIDLESYRVHQ